MDLNSRLVEFSVDKITIINDDRGYKKTICYVQNCSTTSLKIRVAISQKSDPVFRLLNGYDEHTIASGLKHTVILQSEPQQRVPYRGELEAFVDGKLTCGIPIEMLLPSCLIELSSHVVDFGLLVREHQIVTKTFTIANNGTTDGGFNLATESLPPLYQVSPCQGKLKPKEKVEIQIELLCKHLGPFNEILKILSEETRAEIHSVSITGSIEVRKLELLDSSTQSTIEHVEFGSTYYGTSIIQRAILYNNSPASTQFVVLLDTQSNATLEGLDKSVTLALACTPGGLSQDKWREQCNSPQSEEVIGVRPQQGTLNPFETRVIEFVFSPHVYKSETGWSQFQTLVSRRDYTLFFKFVNASAHSSQCSDQVLLEVAATGTALPVDIHLLPATHVDFGGCLVNFCSCKQLQLRNNSPTLPLEFSCRKLAHYRCDPDKGRLEPGQQLELLVSFRPRQLGDLNTTLRIELLGPNGPNSKVNGPALLRTVAVQLNGCGITTHIDGTRRFKTVRLAHPDDRATSVRPHDGEKIRTRYTRVQRYTYLDPDYAWSPEEAAAIREHKYLYTDFIRQRKLDRDEKAKEAVLSRASQRHQLELGIPPADGLEPPCIGTPQKSKKSKVISVSGCGERMATLEAHLTSMSQELSFVQCCSNKAYGANVVSECTAVLVPSQLSQIVIEPTVLDFGCIVVGIPMEKAVLVKNYLSQSFALSIKIDCLELQPRIYAAMESHVSMILPPRSSTEIPFVFQKTTVGNFERSLEYTINRHHRHYIPVRACTVPLSLKLSSHTVVLQEPLLSPPGTGLTGSLVMANDHDIPVPFQWLAKDAGSALAFQMTHPTGVIPAKASLFSEFSCQPSYSCPKSTEFLLFLGEGTSVPSASVTLVTQFGKPMCNFHEKRVFFGAVPLNLTTTTSIHLENSGENHAYFQVSDPSPHPGLQVFPTSGCIAAKGTAELTLTLHSEQLGKVDTDISVQIRQAKTLRLKVIGSVQQPVLHIDKKTFQFGGVYCGAKSSCPFVVTNESPVKAELIFDFCFLKDFLVEALPSSQGEDDPNKGIVPDRNDPSVYTLVIPGKESRHCALQFIPRDVASYDFNLPILVNGSRPPSPPPSPWPPSRNSKMTITSQQAPPLYDVTPTRRVLATALRSPLIVSNTLLNFTFSPKEFEEGVTTDAQEIKMINSSDQPLTWTLDWSGKPRIEDGTFTFALPTGVSFHPPSASSKPQFGEIGYLEPNKEFDFVVTCSPRHHGNFECIVPIFLNGNASNPYCMLHMGAELKGGKISVQPAHIAIQPVPLGITVSALFSVCVEGFAGPVDLDATVPSVDSQLHFGVKFISSGHVEDCSVRGVELTCLLEFSSLLPITLTTHIVFADKWSEKRIRVPVTVAADNSPFTIYEFLANNLSNSTIKLNEASVPTLIMNGGRDNRAASSIGPSLSDLASLVTGGGASTSSIMAFGDLFLQDSISSVCRWLSTFGWPRGRKAISSPTDLRQDVQRGVGKSPGKLKRSSLSQSQGPLLELLTHICGRLPPGIPLTPPPCSTHSEQVNLQYCIYSTILTFLNNQGAQLWCVLPEALLDYKDFSQWRKDNDGAGSVLYPSSREEFEVWSRQAWTHLLMQVIKVLVLPSITARASKDMAAIDPHSSNVYSTPERVLLAWLNQHYVAHRSTIFGGKEAIDRVATTFDVDLMDCTFLACAMAAYCPFLVDSHFRQMYVEPSTPEQCSHNAQILVSALRDIGLDYDCQTTDLCSPNPILLILFCAHLYHHLPSFNPKTSVCFASVLGAVSTQKLQLENPSSKSLVYKVLLRGGDSEAFSVADLGEDIVLQPRQRTELEVTFRGRHVTRQPSPVTLLLVAKGGRSVAGATLAFTLHATVTGAKPMVNKPIVAPLYQPQTISLEVLSPFEQEEEFELHLFESNDQGLVSSPSFKRVNKKSTPVIPASAFDQRSTDRMQLFHSNVHTITLVPGQPTLIPLQFVPLRMESRHCSIVLSSGTQGELVLSVAATIKLPYPLIPHSKLVHPSSFVNEQTKTLHLQTYAGQEVQEELVVGSRNPAFEEAVMAVARWGMSEVELRRRSLTGSLKYAALLAAMTSFSLGAKPKSRDDTLSEESNKLVFVVEGSGSHFATPNSISVPVPGDSEGSAVLQVTFCAEKEGQYECHLVLRSEYDVRTLVVESTVMALERATELEFRTPAMHPVTQEIPVVNPSTVDWHLKATLTGSGFGGPETLLAAALSTTCYPLTFNPKKEEEFLGQLSLMNEVSGSNQIFHLKGLADQPLAEGYIKLHAQAKRSCAHTLHVPNYNERTTTYEVETDLDFITGPTTITVGGGDIADYPLVLCPTIHGTFTGVVAFVARSFSRPQSMLSEIQCRNMDPSPHHVWFHFTCEVEPAPPTGTFSITAHALSTEVMEIKIVNESQELWNLEAKVEGHGLSGPKQLSIEPNSHFTYQITLSPTIVGREKGRVVFTGSQDGEFWYKLDLIMLEPKPVVMPQVVCEIGRNCQQILKLSNPLEHPVTFSPRCTNTKHFIVLGHKEGQVVVPPHSTVEVPILFQPSALGTSEHTAEVSFSNDQLGAQTFIFHGCGVKPSAMEPTIITSSLHTNAIHTFTFTNPLDAPTRFSVSLAAWGGARMEEAKEGNTDHFCLLLKRTHGILLHPGVSLDIPVMFAPDDMSRQEAELTVTTESLSEEGGIVWRYPIGGQPRLLRPASSSEVPQIQCTAKERLEQRLEVRLLGSAGTGKPRATAGAVTLRPVTPGASGGGQLDPIGVAEGAGYRYRLVCGDPEAGPLLEQSTGVRLMRSEEDASGDAVLVFGVVFSPSKPFSCNAELHVISVGGSGTGSDGGGGGGGGGGGIWQFPLHFKATVAAPDDVITVEAKGLHKETQVGFRLTSMVEHPVPFTAYLIPESDPEISVNPTCGDLSPVNTRGTLFCVSYKPTTYGKDHFAKLVIQTDSNQWCYEIIGQLPNYSPPNDVTSKIHHKGVVNLPHPRKNFVRENIHVLCKQ